MTSVVTNDTLLIDLESKLYPVRLTDLSARHTNVSFGPTVPTSFIEALGYAIVGVSAQPAGDVITELEPVIIDNKYVQAFTSREYTQEEISLKLDFKKKNLINTYKNKLRAKLNSGYEFKHNNVTQCLQMRDSDYVKLLVVLKNAEAQINDEDLFMKIRVASNENLTMTPIEVIDLIEKAFKEFEFLHNRFYQLEFDIKAAVDEESLVTIIELYNTI